jgi:hypothetical protein
MATKAVMAFFIAVAVTKAALNFAGVPDYVDPAPHLVGQEVTR